MTRKVLIISAGDSEESAFSELLENLRNRITAVGIACSCNNEEQILKELLAIAGEGVTDILIIPISIPRDNSFIGCLNRAVGRCVEDNSALNIKIVDRYLAESSLEDQIWETITAEYTDSSLLPQTGKSIEELSHSIIDRKLVTVNIFSLSEKVVVRRVIHATADYSFAHTMNFSAGAVEAGIAALQAGKPVICDVNMLKTAMTHVSSEVLCAISSPEVIELAREKNCTRAAASMLYAADMLDGAIVVIGNAPTAIWQLLKMKVKPALVVGLPVGFVGARESKLALIESDFTSIANTTPRGGSPAAAAALNALALLAKKI